MSFNGITTFNNTSTQITSSGTVGLRGVGGVDISSGGVITIGGGSGTVNISNLSNITRLPGVTAGSYYGQSCFVSQDGLTLVVGTYSESAVYVYTRTATNIAFTDVSATRLTSASSGLFGASCALSSDGLTLVVGAQNETGGGAVYVYTRTSTSVAFSASTRLVSGVAGTFGYSCSLSSNGLTLAVASETEASIGAMYIFTRSSTSVAFSAYSSGTPTAVAATRITGPTATSSWFGKSCSLSSNGLILAVGAMGETSYNGAAYIFSRRSTSVAFTSYVSGTPTALAATRITGSAASYFGQSCSLSSDGLTLAVGAYAETSNIGALYVFTRTSTSAVFATYVSSTATTTRLAAGTIYFGGSCAISSDGLTLAVGAGSENSVYLYTRTATTVAFSSYTKMSGSVSKNAGFGQSCSLSSDGLILAVGAKGENTNTGAAYVYQSPTLNTLNVSGTTNLNGGVKMNSNKLDMNTDGYHYIQSKDNGTFTGPMVVGYLGGSLGQSSVVASGLDFSPTLTWSGSNVGIGKTNPAYALDVNGSTYISNPSTLSLYQLQNTINATAGFSALSGDGLTFAVINNGTNLFVFIRSSTSVNFPTSYNTALTAPGTSTYGFNNIAISSDGLTIAMGSVQEAGNTSGSVYVFHRTSGSSFSNGSYTRLTSSTSWSFGNALALSGDGLTIATGGYSSPGAWVYRRYAGGPFDTNQYNTFLTYPNGYFGWSVALSYDGLTLAVSCWADLPNSIYIFNRTAGSNFSTIYSSKITSPTATSHFGIQLSLSNDGLTMSIYSQVESAAYIYNRANTSSVFSSNIRLTPCGSAPLLSGDALTWVFSQNTQLSLFNRASSTSSFSSTPTYIFPNDANGMITMTNDGSIIIRGISISQKVVGYTLDVNGTTRCTNGVWITSDKRIKNNIIDIDDGNALSILRKIQPKTYEYIDKKSKGNNTVIGFIAQEIQEIIPNACTISKDYIPNFYTKCQISLTDDSSIMLVTSPIDITWDDPNIASNVIDLSGALPLIDMSGNANMMLSPFPFGPLVDASGNPFVDASGNPLPNPFVDASGNPLPNPFLINPLPSAPYVPSYNIKIYDQDRNEIKCRTTSILDKRSFLINVTGTRLETEDEYFLYGQEVDNFHNLDKTAIYTVVTAAVQDMDRIQQAQAGEIQAQQETQSQMTAKIQEQQTKIQADAENINALESQVASLYTQNAAFEARLAALESK